MFGLTGGSGNPLRAVKALANALITCEMAPETSSGVVMLLRIIMMVARSSFKIGLIALRIGPTRPPAPPVRAVTTS